MPWLLSPLGKSLRPALAGSREAHEAGDSIVLFEVTDEHFSRAAESKERTTWGCGDAMPEAGRLVGGTRAPARPLVILLPGLFGALGPVSAPVKIVRRLEWACAAGQYGGDWRGGRTLGVGPYKG